MQTIQLSVVNLRTVICMCPEIVLSTKHIFFSYNKKKGFMAAFFPMTDTVQTASVWKVCFYIKDLCCRAKKKKTQVKDILLKNICMSLKHVWGVALLRVSPSFCVFGRVCLTLISYMWETLCYRFRVTKGKFTSTT